MKKFFALITKPTNVYEIYSIISSYNIKDVTLYVAECPWSSYPDIKNYCAHKLKKKTLKLNIKQIKNKDILKIDWIKKLNFFNIVALPMSLKSFYTIIRKLRANNIKTIQISDGMGDSLSLIKYIFATRIDSFFSLHKIFIYFIYKINIMDECFFTCYPLKAALSKATLPVSKYFLPDQKIIRLLKKNKIEDLILGKRDKNDTLHNVNKIIKKNKIINYCLYERGKKIIIINGKKIKLKNIMITEEIINTNLIKRVHGGISTVTFYAKINKINVDLILDKFRPFFLYYFSKQKFFQI